MRIEKSTIICKIHELQQQQYQQIQQDLPVNVSVLAVMLQVELHDLYAMLAEMAIRGEVILYVPENYLRVSVDKQVCNGGP